MIHTVKRFTEIHECCDCYYVEFVQLVKFSGHLIPYHASIEIREQVSLHKTFLFRTFQDKAHHQL